MQTRAKPHQCDGQHRFLCIGTTLIKYKALSQSKSQPQQSNALKLSRGTSMHLLQKGIYHVQKYKTRMFLF